MKHTVRVTIFLIGLFILSQLTGLFLINKSITINKEVIGNETILVANYTDTAVGARPDMSPAMTFWYIIFAVGIGTALVLLLIRFRKPGVWKVWFLMAVGLTISVSLGVLFNFWIAYFIGFGLALWKVFRPNIYVHNLTEVLMYSGIGVIFVPMFQGDIIWALILLIAISLYDMYAVWKSKHMVDMAQFQTKSGVFAGLNIGYTVKKASSSKKDINEEVIRPKKTVVTKEASQERKNAILGGGDIAFPLLFSGAVMQSLLIDIGLSKIDAFIQANIITLFVALALTLLFIFAKKDRFYPAMPFVTAGAVIGFLFILALNPQLFSLFF